MSPGELQAAGEKRVLTRSHQSLSAGERLFSCCCKYLRGAAAVPGARLLFACHPSPSRARGVPLCSSSRDTSCFFSRLLAERLHYTASELKEVPVGRTGRSASRARAGKQAGLCARAEGRFLVLGAAPRCLQGRRDTTHPGGDLQEIRRERACFVATDRLKLTRPLVPSQRDDLAQKPKLPARYHGISMGRTSSSTSKFCTCICM